MPALVQQGFRVVAPNLRGFGESSKPSDVDAYALRYAQADVLAVLDALGVAKCVNSAHAVMSRLHCLLSIFRNCSVHCDAGTGPEQSIPHKDVHHVQVLLGGA